LNIKNSFRIMIMNTSAKILGFEEQVINVQKAIADFENGQKLNIAIIAEPFAGKTSILDIIEKENANIISRISVQSIMDNKGKLATSSKLNKIVMIDDCHFLYMRKIGGFSILEAFLNSISAYNDHLFITAWNLFSWNYLEEAANIGINFPIQITLPKLKDSEIKECILSAYGPDEITFVNDVEGYDEKIIEIVRHPIVIKVLHKTINIVFLKINFSVLKKKFQKAEGEIDTKDLIFKKINRISNGNPGIAEAIWENNLEYPNVKLSQFEHISSNIDLDYNESFILSNILAMRIIKKENLSDIVDDPHIDTILFRLLQQGLIGIDDANYSIKPEAIRNSVELLQKLRLVW
jgi:hypothetical protein